MKKDTGLNSLLDKYLEDNLTSEERELLQELLLSADSSAELEQYIDLYITNLREDQFVKNAVMLRQVQEKLQAVMADSKTDSDAESPAPVHRIHFLRNRWPRFAAAVIFLVGIGLYLWLQNEQGQKQKNEVNTPALVDVAPGKGGAILTLADGTQLVLDSLGNGVIATQAGSEVVLKDGQLTYEGGVQSQTAAAYNTVTTPKGRQFNITLPDGTKIWLNAASSLKYPTAFTGSNRQIAITGEAFMEVAKDINKPFLVNINDKATVEVLGTSFNVSAYDDEEHIETTLLNGSVRVASEAEEKSVVLRPGQQGRIGKQSSLSVINNVDIDKIVAWKNGVFNFNNASLEQVMRQIERWYNVEVIFEKTIPKMDFWGEMGRNLSLNQVLKLLEKSNVHFRIEDGRRLVVLP